MLWQIYRESIDIKNKKKVFRKVIDLFCVWLSIDEVLTRRGKMEVKTWQEFFIINPKGIHGKIEVNFFAFLYLNKILLLCDYARYM